MKSRFIWRKIWDLNFRAITLGDKDLPGVYPPCNRKSKNNFFDGVTFLRKKRNQLLHPFYNIDIVIPNVVAYVQIYFPNKLLTLMEKYFHLSKLPNSISSHILHSCRTLFLNSEIIDSKEMANIIWQKVQNMTPKRSVLKLIVNPTPAAQTPNIKFPLFLFSNTRFRGNVGLFFSSIWYAV